MALVQKKMSKNRMIILASILIVFIGLTGYLLYDGYFKSSAPDGTTVTNDSNVRITPIVKDLGEQIVNDDRYSELEEHGTLPVEPGASGRTNPFVPPAQ